jgi:hypothetical protein
MNNNDEELVGGSLLYDQEKEFVVDWVSPLIYDIYPKKGMVGKGKFQINLKILLMRRNLNGERYGLTIGVCSGPILTVIREPQIHLPNPSYVEEEDKFVDEEFQEDDFVDEKLKHGDVHEDV